MSYKNIKINFIFLEVYEVFLFSFPKVLGVSQTSNGVVAHGYTARRFMSLSDPHDSFGRPNLTTNILICILRIMLANN